MIARALRRVGYSVARDIIPRELAASLDYAKKMHFRTLIYLGEQATEVRIINLSDGSERMVPIQTVVADGFTL